jgi:hypothetical protein
VEVSLVPSCPDAEQAAFDHPCLDRLGWKINQVDLALAMMVLSLRIWDLGFAQEPKWMQPNGALMAHSIPGFLLGL